MMDGQKATTERMLQESWAALRALVEPMTAAQWSFRPEAGAWSAAECCEHLLLAEMGMMRTLPKLGPAAAEQVAGKLEKILEYVPERRGKVQAPERVMPKGTIAAAAEFVSALERMRTRTIAWLNEADPGPQSHAMEHMFFGMLDGHQWLVLTAAHTERHRKQIEEITAHPSWPRD
jgi:hypothetical protein